jgi:hypothetical protein
MELRFLKNATGRSLLVMPGLDPGIHVLPFCRRKDVDGRVKPGHDGWMQSNLTRTNP